MRYLYCENVNSIAKARYLIKIIYICNFQLKMNIITMLSKKAGLNEITSSRAVKRKQDMKFIIIKQILIISSVRDTF